MKTALLTWELGGGLGHLINLLPLAQGLLNPHPSPLPVGEGKIIVYAAVQDIGRAERVFRGLDIGYLQAPAKAGSSLNPIEPQRTFAHILHNRGFGDRDELRALAAAWRNLFGMVRPNLIVFDHSPAALLAARGLPAKKAIIGTGFFCPVDEYPMRDLRACAEGNSPHLPGRPFGCGAQMGTGPEQALTPGPSPEAGEGSNRTEGDSPIFAGTKIGTVPAEKLREDEDRVLANANEVLAGWGQPPMERLSRLFHDVDESFLVTLPELDHYAGRCYTLTPCPSPGGRGEIRYWGAWPNVGGRRPEWPEGKGKRVFAYVKPFAALPRLLRQLCDLGQPTIVYAGGLADGLRRQFPVETMHFESEPLDLAEVGKTCDLAILNGNHGTSVSMLLAGKPTIQVPITLEQSLFSQAAARLGAARVAMPNRPMEVVAGLMEMLGSEVYAAAARRFAAKYAGFDPERQIAAVVGRAAKLLSGG